MTVKINADTSDGLKFVSDTSSTVDIQSNGTTKFSVGSTIDCQGNELVLDADADTSIHASTDDLIDFKIAGADRGKIGNSSTTNRIFISGGNMGISLGGSGRGIPTDADGVGADDSMDWGQSNYRWDDFYATNGTINTSDRNDKQSIQSLSTKEMNVAKKLSGLFKTFKWKSAVEKKGDSARTHTGIIAQDIQQAFTDEGLDSSNYGLFISNTWYENDSGIEVESGTEGAIEKTRLGVRYPELLSFVQAYNDQRFTALETRITALESE